MIVLFLNVNRLIDCFLFCYVFFAPLLPALRGGEFPFKLVYAGAEMAELLENGIRLAREEIGGLFAVDPHDSPRDPDDGRMGRNVFQNDAAGADLGKFAHGDISENFRPRTYDATLFDRRVTFVGLVFARSAEGHALIDNDPFLHDGGFSIPVKNFAVWLSILAKSFHRIL